MLIGPIIFPISHIISLSLLWRFQIVDSKPLITNWGNNVRDIRKNEGIVIKHYFFWFDSFNMSNEEG